MSSESIGRLEERIAWMEKHILEQDKVMLAQGDELERLKTVVASLRDRLNSRDLPLDPNERPPHY